MSDKNSNPVSRLEEPVNQAESFSYSHNDDHDDPALHRGAHVMRLDQIVKKYPSYSDFLDSQINESDMFYLEDRGIARTIKELGFHGNSEKITREQFANKKGELAVIKKIENFKSGAKYLHTDRDVFLLELARREDANLNGRLVTIIYLRDRNSKGQEVSSYIDFAQRLREDDFANIFAGRERLVPKTTDISHYNWDTNVTHSNNTPNFDVIYRGARGIQLKCKRDRRIVDLDSTRKILDTNLEDTTRTLLRSRNYAQVVLFDHFIRFWAKEDDPDVDYSDLPAKEKSTTEEALNLYDAVTAAILEDDMIEIARNALGGNLHQDHHGQWAPADGVTTEKSKNDTKNSLAKKELLETSVMGTIHELYDAHKDDTAVGTLGNFTFMQLIEQLRLLLPPQLRQAADHDVEEIAKLTSSTSRDQIPQNLSQVVVNTDDLVEKQHDKIVCESSATDKQLKEFRSPTDSYNRVNEATRRLGETSKMPGIVQSLEEGTSENSLSCRKSTLSKTSGTLSGNEDKETSHNKNRDDQRTKAAAKTLDVKSGSAPDKSQDYFASLEAQILDVFNGKWKRGKVQLPPYPNPVEL